MEINLLEAIELLTAFQAFLFAIYLLTSDKKKNTRNIFIAFYLIVLALNVSHSYVKYYITPSLPNISIFLSMIAFIMAPMLYLYIKSSLIPEFKLKRSDILHLVPFIAVNILIIPDFYLENLKENPVEREYHNLYVIGLYLGFYLQSFIYLGVTFKLLWRMKKLYYENFSNTDTGRYKYLYQLNSLVSIVFLFSSIKNIMFFNIQGPVIEYASHIVLLSILIFFCWIILKGLQSPELFVGFNVNQITLKEMIKEEEEITSNIKYEGIAAEIKNQFNGLEETLKNYMGEFEPYLDASLSLQDLARKMEIPSKELSIFINHNLNKHFFDFINEYRIDKAKHILKDPGKNEYTVLEILYDVGFNSKSSFNTAFKKYTGLTPTEYRRS